MRSDILNLSRRTLCALVAMATGSAVSLLAPAVTVTLSALTVTTASAQTVSAWAPNVAYTAGTVVSYNGTDYKCLQSHTSEVGWEPPNVPALWTAVGAASGG